MRGKIVIITGSDGSGKATQTEILKKRASSKGYKIKSMSFPNYEGFWGKRVKEYLSGKYGSLEEVNPKHASQLFALDRLDAKPVIKNWLESGHNIIFDRYLESNFAHQGAKFKGDERIEMINWLHDFEVKKLGLPEADLVIYLDLPVEFGVKAIKERNRMNNEEDKKDIHEENAEYLNETQETYNYLIQNNENWKRINCLDSNNKRLSKEEVAEQVWNLAKEHLVK